MNNYQRLKDRIIEIAEEQGWKVTADEHNGSSESTDFEFARFTDRGQDFSFTVEMEGCSIVSIIENMDAYYENYDPDEETMLWVGPDGHGKNGAPYRLSEILKDMEQAESMVKELLDSLIDANIKEKLWSYEED